MTANWKALKLWNDPEYLANHVDLAEMKNVEVCENNTFFFLDQKSPLAKLKLPGINLTLNHHVANFTSKEFFKTIYDPAEKNHYYWYGKVGRELAK